MIPTDMPGISVLLMKNVQNNKKIGIYVVTHSFCMSDKISPCLDNMKKLHNKMIKSDVSRKKYLFKKFLSWIP
jgi:hypothetical protein